MIALMVFLLGFSVHPSPRCEEHGPRLDGTYVTICGGSVTRVRDRLGNSREWKQDGETVILRSVGSPPVTVGRDGR
jgi:hypothetical protein